MDTTLSDLTLLLNKLEVKAHLNQSSDTSENLEILLEIEPFKHTHSFVLEIIEIESAAQLTDGISIYQFFVDFRIDETLHAIDSLKELHKIFSYINATLAIGSFNLLPDYSLCFFKYNLLINKNNSNDSLEKMTKTIWMVDALLKSYTTLFIKILTEDLTFQDAMDRGLIIK